MESLKRKEDYRDENIFSPIGYMKDYSGTPDRFALESTLAGFFHKVFKTGQVHGDSILDVGCGPSLVQLIVGSPWFSEVYLADYAQTNLDVQTSWLKRGPDALNWEPHFKRLVLWMNEGKEWHEYEEKMRKSVRQILLCDVHKDNPLDPHVYTDFDVVTSSLCLEAACDDVTSFKQAVKNIGSLVKLDGFLILSGVLNQSYYYVVDKNFFSLPVTEDDVKSAITDAGFVDIKIEVNPLVSEPSDGSDFNGVYIATGQKQNNANK